jgi:hypothetical protein
MEKDSFLKTAIEAAKEAGKIHLDYFGKCGEVKKKVRVLTGLQLQTRKLKKQYFQKLLIISQNIVFLGKKIY